MGQHPHVTSQTLSALQAYLQHAGTSPVAAPHEAVAMVYRQMLKVASELSYLDGFRVMAALLLAAVPLVWIMKKPHFKKQAAE